MFVYMKDWTNLFLVIIVIIIVESLTGVKKYRAGHDALTDVVADLEVCC